MVDLFTDKTHKLAWFFLEMYKCEREHSNLVEVKLVSRFLNNMDVEGRFRLIFKLLKISIDVMLGTRTKSILNMRKIKIQKYECLTNLQKTSE